MLFHVVLRMRLNFLDISSFADDNVILMPGRQQDESLLE